MNAGAGESNPGLFSRLQPLLLGVVLDLGLLLSVPAILVAVATLPQSVRRSLAFEYTAPTLQTAVAAPFVHLATTHLLVNLTGYALVAPAAYLLSRASGLQRRFRVVFVALLLVCPPVLSYLNLTIVRDGASVGFSGVLMALHGYLALSLATYLQRELGIGSERTTGPLLFFLGLTLMTGLTLTAVLSNPVVVAVHGVAVPVTRVLAATLAGLLLALTLTLLLYALALETALQTVRTQLSEAADSWQFELLVLSGGVFVGTPFATFPTDPALGDSVVNLYVHLLGYALGFISTYTTVMLQSRLPSTVIEL